MTTHIPIEGETVHLEGLGACTVEDIVVTIETPEGQRHRITGTMLRQWMDGEVAWAFDIDGWPTDPLHSWNR